MSNKAWPIACLDLGRELIDAHHSNVWIALHSEPDCRAEIMLAWLLQEAEMDGDLEKCIKGLAELIDAADWVSWTG